MGISGLLPLLKPIAKQEHVRAFASTKVAVDVSSWLHKGAYGCAYELCMGIDTDKYVQYCLRKVEMLRYFKIEPCLVFDGRSLPLKADVNKERTETRAKHKQLGLECVNAGDRRGAVEHFQKSVEITPEMVGRVIAALKEHKVPFVVAPYEADAQMAFMARNGLVHAVISEDSDLLAFGCPRVFYKMDKDGNGSLVELSNVQRVSELASFSHDMFLEMCILSGCDYLASPKNLGIKSALKLVKKYKTYTRTIQMARLDGTRFPPTYLDDFRKAVLCFRHQRVFNPTRRELVHLTPLPEDLGDEDLSFLGPPLEETVAQQLCEGNVSASTLEPFPQFRRVNTPSRFPDSPSSRSSSPAASPRTARTFSSPTPGFPPLRAASVSPSASASPSPSASSPGIARPAFSPRKMPASVRSASSNSLLSMFQKKRPLPPVSPTPAASPKKACVRSCMESDLGMYARQSPHAASPLSSPSPSPPLQRGDLRVVARNNGPPTSIPFNLDGCDDDDDNADSAAEQGARGPKLGGGLQRQQRQQPQQSQQSPIIIDDHDAPSPPLRSSGNANANANGNHNATPPRLTSHYFANLSPSPPSPAARRDPFGAQHPARPSPPPSRPPDPPVSEPDARPAFADQPSPGPRQTSLHHAFAFASTRATSPVRDQRRVFGAPRRGTGRSALVKQGRLSLGPTPRGAKATKVLSSFTSQQAAPVPRALRRSASAPFPGPASAPPT